MIPIDAIGPYEEDLSFTFIFATRYYQYCTIATPDITAYITTALSDAIGPHKEDMPFTMASINVIGLREDDRKQGGRIRK